MYNQENNPQSTTPLDWRQRIEELTQLEGEPAPDLNRIWDKMESRLTVKPKRKKKIAYWLIAASLITAVLVLYIGNIPKRHKENVLVQQPHKTPVKENSIPGNDVRPKLINTEKNKEAVQVVKQSGKKNKEFFLLDTSQSLRQNNEIATPKGDDYSLTESPVLKSNIIFDNNPLKTTRVIHLNRLKNSNNNTGNITVQSNFLQQEGSKSFNPGTKLEYNDEPLFKIKLSLQN